MLNIGIIGAGRIGKVHLESISYHVKNAQVVAVADPFMNGETKAFIEGFGVTKIYDDYTRYRKDYAIQGEVLTYTEFKRQLKHSDLYVDSNYQRRMGEKNQKVWVVRFDLLSSRSDVSGFIADDVKPLT